MAAPAISSVATVQAEEEDKNEAVLPVDEGPISIDQIPAAARETILREAGGGTLMMVHEESWTGEPMYEAHIRQGRTDHIVWVDAAGHILHKH